MRCIASVSLALVALLTASCAQSTRPTNPPSPFGPAVKTIEVRYLDAPDAFHIEADGVGLGSIVAGTVLGGPLVGGLIASSDSTSESKDAVEVRQLLTDNQAALERFAFPSHAAMDVAAEIERNGWATVSGKPQPIAPVEGGLPARRKATDALAQAMTTDALLIVDARLTIHDRARYATLRLGFVAYVRDPDGSMRRRTTLGAMAAESGSVDDKRTPPKTMRGQILEYGGLWLADDARRLRATYSENLLPLMDEGFGRLRRGYRSFSIFD